MPISVSCPSCSASFKVKDEYAGKRAKCPKCGNPLTIPAPAADFEMVDDEPAPAPKAARPVAAKPVVASKPRVIEDDEDEPVSPKRKRGASSDDEDDTPKAKSKRRRDSEEEDEKPKGKKRRASSDDDDDEDDRTKKKRRRDEDDDDEPKKKSALPLILGIVGGVVLLGGGITAAVLMMQGPGQAKATGTIPSATSNNPNGPPPNPNPGQNAGLRVNMTNMGLIALQMSLQHVEGILGPGRIADETTFAAFVTGLKQPADAARRWQAKQKLGQVYLWEEGQDRILVAFSDDPKGKGVVEGVAAKFGSRDAFEYRDFVDRTPVATLTIEELARDRAKYKDKYITIRGPFMMLGPATFGDVVLYTPTAAVRVNPPAKTRFDWNGKPPELLEQLEFTGLLQVADDRLSVFDAVLVRRTPNDTAPIEITAEALAAEFATNATAAHAKYTGKALKISGVVASAVGSDGYQIVLRGNQKPGEKKTFDVRCTFEEEDRADSKQLKLNAPVSVIGLCTGLEQIPKTEVYYINLVVCRIVK